MENVNSTYIPQIRTTPIDNFQQHTFEDNNGKSHDPNNHSNDHQITEKFLKQTVENVEQILPDHYSVKYKYHEKTESYYVQVIDDVNNEVIREIPSEKLLDTYASMKEMLGLLFDIKI